MRILNLLSTSFGAKIETRCSQMHNACELLGWYGKQVHDLGLARDWQKYTKSLKKMAKDEGVERIIKVLSIKKHNVLSEDFGYKHIQNVRKCGFLFTCSFCCRNNENCLLHFWYFSSSFLCN